MSARVRVGVIGLGTMGRNHVRVLGQLPLARLVGAVDPRGDETEALGPGATHPDLDSLLKEGIEAAVVAVPSVDHAAVALRLAEAGVHVLIEKPIAGDLESARAICAAFAGTGLVAGVGHIERFNAANQELRRRLEAGELGAVISISTERVGPYPLRIRDVGVVRDLATHDIDLVHWLGGPIEALAAHAGYRMGGRHEDLVEAIGRLRSGAVVRISVNWLTPTKRRQLMVLGERGAMLADMLSSDLTYFSNADVPMEWDQLQRLRGVSEGDSIRYALRKREPLAAELESFLRAVRGDADAQIVTLDEGLRAVETAEQILEIATCEGGR
jgi:UDP-N-acetylglucosamine 3-dehydrogenase